MGKRVIFLILIGLMLTGCASTAPLPSTLNIVPPSPDVPHEIAAFSGIWEGQWWGFQDAILVVEKIDVNKAEILYSIGLAQGFEPRYFYQTGEVAEGPVIKFSDPNGDQMIIKMNKELNTLYGTYIEKKTGSNAVKLILHKRGTK